MRPFLLVIPFLISCASIPSATSQRRPATSSRIDIDPRFAGDWEATKNCEKPSSWPSRLLITESPNTPGQLEFRKGNAISIFKPNGESTAKDSDGITFRTIWMADSYNKGTQLLVGSIWRNEDDYFTPDNPKAISVMITIYKLLDSSTLVFEKYGYETEERPGDLMVRPYNNSFPNNYHCVYKRK